MNFTTYGKALAAREEDARREYRASGPQTGAAASMHAIGFDAGIPLLLTGHDVNGKRFSRNARSVSSAFFAASAMWGIERAWHVREDGTRRLVFRR